MKSTFGGCYLHILTCSQKREGHASSITGELAQIASVVDYLYNYNQLILNVLNSLVKQMGHLTLIL